MRTDSGAEDTCTLVARAKRPAALEAMRKYSVEWVGVNMRLPAPELAVNAPTEPNAGRTSTRRTSSRLHESVMGWSEGTCCAEALKVRIPTHLVGLPNTS